MIQTDLFSDPLRVLVAFECSGTVRRAFDRLGHDVWSCDIKPAEDRSNRHMQQDVRGVLGWGWDLMIVAHPPCTRLCNSGVRWLSVPPPGRQLADMWRELDEGAALFSDVWNADIPRIAVENPVMHGHAKERIAGYVPPAQTLQPWQFGDWESKRTCLWLKGLAPLVPAYATLDQARAGLQLPADAKPLDRVHKMPGGKKQAAERSRFFDGFANAMALQWGGQAMEQARAA